MFKKAFIILSFVILLALGLNIKQPFAQRYYEEEPLLEADVFEKLEALEKKIDQVLALLQALDSKEILKKLDLILKEQELIKEELRIIKIRTMHR